MDHSTLDAAILPAADMLTPLEIGLANARHVFQNDIRPLLRAGCSVFMPAPLPAAQAVK